MTRAADIQRVLADAVRDSGVPGAVLGFFSEDGRVHEWSQGVANARTGVPVTADTLFQIGSITKTFTATLVMKLAEQGRLALDAPVHEFFPDLAGSPCAGVGSVTVRQLLSHTAGIESDNFLDFGRGDDCLARFAWSCRHMPLLHPPGELFSYSNGGYSILGRIAEDVTGVQFDRLLRDEVLAPLGLAKTTTLPEEAILHRVAVGHWARGDGYRPTSLWSASRACGPEGLICTTVAELLSFASAHLATDVTHRRPLLSSKSLAVMREPHAQAPEFVAGEARAWGLGWALHANGNGALIGHDGSIMGNSSFLRIAPERGSAYALLTNGGGSGPADIRDACEAILGDPFGPREAAPVGVVGAKSLPLAAYAGTYSRLNAALEVNVGPRGLELSTFHSQVLLEQGSENVEHAPLIPLTDAAFAAPSADPRAHVVFVRSDDSHSPEYAYFGLRAHRRER